MKTKQEVRKCLICEVRPASDASTQGYCKHCISQIEADKRRKAKPLAFRYATYQGTTIEFRSNGNGTFKPYPITSNPDSLPQRLLINLDKYCAGFTRDQVKKLKRVILSFAKS